MVETILILLLIFGIFFLLYQAGLIAVTTKRSVMFIGSMNGKKARFTSCSGTMKRIVRFKEDRSYCFTLDSQLHSGVISVELFDTEENCVMKLGAFLSYKNIQVEKGKKYFLTVRFSNASGSYELNWE